MIYSKTEDSAEMKLLKRQNAELLFALKVERYEKTEIYKKYKELKEKYVNDGTIEKYNAVRAHIKSNEIIEKQIKLTKQKKVATNKWRLENKEKYETIMATASKKYYNANKDAISAKRKAVRAAEKKAAIIQPVDMSDIEAALAAPLADTDGGDTSVCL